MSAGPEPTPARVVLAAGASRRLGEPKALARLGSRSALHHLLAAGRDLDRVPPLVVTGRHHEEIERALEAEPPGLEVEVLRNPDWARGRTGGLARAAARRPGQDLLVCPVDCPLVPAEVLAALVRAWLAAGRPARGWLAPRAPDGRHGHPLVLGRDLAAACGDLDPGTPLRALRGEAEPLWGLPLPQPEILDDLDTPADLAALRARPGT